MVEIIVSAGPVGGLVNDEQMRSVVDLGLAGPDQGNEKDSYPFSDYAYYSRST